MHPYQSNTQDKYMEDDEEEVDLYKKGCFLVIGLRQQELGDKEMVATE